MLRDQAHERADEIHIKEDALIASLAKIASAISEARSLLSVPSHIENIAINIMRVVEGTRIRIKGGLLFSDRAILETQKLFTTAKHALKKTGGSSFDWSKDNHSGCSG